jgi:hypothetical protein
MPPRLGMPWLVAFAVMAGLLLCACTKDTPAIWPITNGDSNPKWPSASKRTRPRSEEPTETASPKRGTMPPEKRYGDLQVVAPTGATVAVDGVDMGVVAVDGGLFLPGLVSGVRKVSVGYPGYDSYEGSVFIPPHRTSTLVLTLIDFKTKSATDANLEQQLKRKVGGLHIRGVPSHPPIKVFVNSVPVGDAPVEVSPLPAGATPIRLVRGATTVSGVLTVIPGKTLVVRVDMSKNELPIEAEEPMAPAPGGASL